MQIFVTFARQPGSQPQTDCTHEPLLCQRCRLVDESRMRLYLFSDESLAVSTRVKTSLFSAANELDI